MPMSWGKLFPFFGCFDYQNDYCDNYNHHDHYPHDDDDKQCGARKAGLLRLRPYVVGGGVPPSNASEHWAAVHCVSLVIIITIIMINSDCADDDDHNNYYCRGHESYLYTQFLGTERC